MEDTRVNLFLIGAMKAGTTSFMELLSQHPKIYTSPIKEPHFFLDELPKILYEPSSFFNVNTYFEKDFPKPLHIVHVTDSEHYKKLFSLSKDEIYKLEGSTMYLHAPNVAEKIYEYNPDAKIVVLLRDPIKRAFSHYTMLVGLSRETRSFETVMQNDIDAYNNNKLPWYSCLGMSLYKEPIERFRKQFKSIQIVYFEDFTVNKLETLNNVFNFLDLEGLSRLDAINTNPTRKLRFKWGMYLLKKMGIKDYFSAIFSSKFKQKIFRLLSSSKKQTISLQTETLKALEEIFKKESVV